MSFKEFVDVNIKIASQILMEARQFDAQAVVCDEKNEWGIALLALDKEKWNECIHDLVKKLKAKYVVLISETWFTDNVKPEEMVLPVHANPFRKEALVFTAYAKSGEKELVIIPFDHADPKTIKMEKPRRDMQFVSNIFESPWAR